MFSNYLTLRLINEKHNSRSLVILFLHTFMCSPVEGPWRTETSYFFNKIVVIKVLRAFFFTICVIIFQSTGRIFIRCHALYICIYIYLHIYNAWQTCTHIVKLLYELRSRVVCCPKIKLNPRVLGFCFILCCA